MPKYSDLFLLSKAIENAILDRDSFSDAYSRIGPESDEAIALIEKMKGIKEKSFKSMNDEDLMIAYYAFLYGEQWQCSLREAQSSKLEIKTANAWARRFKEVRLRKWGQSTLERILLDKQ